MARTSTSSSSGSAMSCPVVAVAEVLIPSKLKTQDGTFTNNSLCYMEVQYFDIFPSLGTPSHVRGRYLVLANLYNDLSGNVQKSRGFILQRRKTHAKNLKPTFMKISQAVQIFASTIQNPTRNFAPNV